MGAPQILLDGRNNKKEVCKQTSFHFLNNIPLGGSSKS